MTEIGWVVVVFKPEERHCDGEVTYVKGPFETYEAAQDWAGQSEDCLAGEFQLKFIDGRARPDQGARRRMKAIKFVRPAALDDHLRLGWKQLYTRRAMTRQKPAWLYWGGDGPPHHPEPAKLMAIPPAREHGED
jgi:hypothetical protein